MLWTRNSFSYEWVKKEDIVRLGAAPVETPSGSHGMAFPEYFPLDCIAELKWDCFYGGLPERLKEMVAYLKASTNEKMYSNYLQAARETEKEEVMEPSCSQTADNMSKPKVTSFFPLPKLKGTQTTKTPAVRVVHLEEGGSDERRWCWEWRPWWHWGHGWGVYSVPC